MLDWIKNYQFNNTLALYTYWIPLGVCVTVYIFRFVERYRDDLKKSEETYDVPTLTIGVIVGHLLLAITPAVNLFAMVFDCMGSILKWFGRVLDIPLVKKRRSL